MKIIFWLLLMANIFCFGDTVKADGTWVLAAHGEAKPPTPGTIGEQYDLSTLGVYIDVKSIVKRGKFAYYNEGTVFLNQHLRPSAKSNKTWDFQLAEPTQKYPGIANCETRQTLDARGIKKKQSNFDLMIVKFVCDK
jgi:hypothetical protein